MLKSFFKICTALCLLATFTSSAFDKQPFTPELHQAAIKSGTPFLVDVFAPWCPTCAKQQTILADYFKQNPDSTLKVLIVDFDNQKEWVTHFRAPRQSTLLLYKGEEQLWFSVAETDRERIYHQLQLAERK